MKLLFYFPGEDVPGWVCDADMIPAPEHMIVFPEHTTEDTKFRIHKVVHVFNDIHMIECHLARVRTP